MCKIKLLLYFYFLSDNQFIAQLLLKKVLKLLYINIICDFKKNCFCFLKWSCWSLFFHLIFLFQEEEAYVCIYSHWYADTILFHHQGGVDIGDVNAKVSFNLCFSCIIGLQGNHLFSKFISSIFLDTSLFHLNLEFFKLFYFYVIIQRTNEMRFTYFYFLNMSEIKKIYISLN